MTGLSAARLRAHERHINTLLDSVPPVVILIWVLLAATVDAVGPLMWCTLVGYTIQSAWLLWLAARADGMWGRPRLGRSEEHTSELQSPMRISYAAFCLKNTHKYAYKYQTDAYKT